MPETKTFYDKDGVEFTLDRETQLWHPPKGDPHPAVVGPGEVEEERQPTYGHPPNNAQVIAAEIAEELER